MDKKNRTQTSSSRHKRQRRRHRAAKARANGGGSSTGSVAVTNTELHAITESLVSAMRKESTPVTHRQKDVPQNKVLAPNKPAATTDAPLKRSKKQRKKAKATNQVNTGACAKDNGRQAAHNTNCCCYCCPNIELGSTSHVCRNNRAVTSSRAQTLHSTLNNQKLSNLTHRQVRLTQSDTVVLYNTRDKRKQLQSAPDSQACLTPAAVSEQDLFDKQTTDYEHIGLDDLSMRNYPLSDLTTGNSDSLEQRNGFCTADNFNYSSISDANAAASNCYLNGTHCGIKHTFNSLNISEIFHESRLRSMLCDARKIAADLLQNLSRFSSDTQLLLQDKTLSHHTICSLKEILRILQVLHFTKPPNSAPQTEQPVPENDENKPPPVFYECNTGADDLPPSDCNVAIPMAVSSWFCKNLERKQSPPAARSALRNGKRLSRLEEYLLIKNSELEENRNLYGKLDSSASPASQTRTIYADVDDFLDDDYLSITAKEKETSFFRRIFNNSFGLFCAAYISMIFTYETMDVAAYIAILSILFLLLALLYFGVI